MYTLAPAGMTTADLMDQLQQLQLMPPGQRQQVMQSLPAAQQQQLMHAWYNSFGDLWGDVQTGFNWLTQHNAQNVQNAGHTVSNVGGNIANIGNARVNISDLVTWVALGGVVYLLLTRR